ncbi:MAG: hypothetical protein ABIF71_01735 [Planctomycetota bacterium]
MVNGASQPPADRPTEVEVLSAAREMNLLGEARRAAYVKVRQKGFAYSVALTQAGISIGQIRSIEARALENRVRWKAGPAPAARAASLRERFNRLTAKPVTQLLIFGLAGFIGCSGFYFGFRSAFGAGGPSVQEINAVVFAGIDQNDWPSDANRKQHIYNIAGLLLVFKQCRTAGDGPGTEQCEQLIMDYLSIMMEKDPQFYPQLRNEFDAMKASCYFTK